MYETALPDETRQRLSEMEPAGLVVGIASYRNAQTVGVVAACVAEALDRFYPQLRPVLVHADGHSLDETLAVAARVPLPPTVRRITTRYQGLPGRGSALRAIFESATALRCRALLLAEADVVSFEPAWVQALAEPVLTKQVDLALPRYALVRPARASADLLAYPLLAAMFGLPLRYPVAGEVAMSGGVATFFAARDVWETDVARGGVDLWMAAEVALGGGRLGEIPLGPKRHRAADTGSVAEAKFLQQVGTLFRLGQLHEKVWRPAAPPVRVAQLGQPGPVLPDSQGPLPEPLALWQASRRAVAARLAHEWAAFMQPAQWQAIEALLALPDDAPAFPDTLWARVVYDFLVTYNLGEGDPDKVVLSLYDLFALRHAALLAQSRAAPNVEAAREAAIQRQAAAFRADLPFLRHRWASYISPEQAALWRERGLAR